MAPHDKRTNTRFPVEIDIQLVHREQQVLGRTVNLSLGGALLRVPAEIPIKVGDRVEASIRLPDLDRPLLAKADVRWINDRDPELVGIQFVTGFRAKETWALGRFLDRQSPA